VNVAQPDGPNRDKRYLAIVVEPIRVCATYKPKMGCGPAGCDLRSFQTLYRSDPFYAWFGLDNPLMYAAHKAAGGMTSLYRQIGIGCEHLFRQVLQDELELAADEATWSYEVTGANRKIRTLSLDGRIPLDAIRTEPATKARVRKWIQDEAKELGVDEQIAAQLKGVVFEVRQGYKSKDSKRQNADISNAATAYTKAYLPCVVVMSNQIDADILIRYRAEKWAVLTASTARSSALQSTYVFFREIIGYDLAGFFERHSSTLKNEVAAVLEKLLTPD